MLGFCDYGVEVGVFLFVSKQERGREEDRHPGRPGSGTERTRVPGTRGLGGPEAEESSIGKPVSTTLANMRVQKECFFSWASREKEPGIWPAPRAAKRGSRGLGRPWRRGRRGGALGTGRDRSAGRRGSLALGLARGAQGGFGLGSLPAPAPPRKGPKSTEEGRPATRPESQLPRRLA